MNTTVLKRTKVTRVT